jgi:hypothetical protein
MLSTWQEIVGVNLRVRHASKWGLKEKTVGQGAVREMANRVS